MFQILNFTVPANGKIIIDEQLKTQYSGISGLTVWTPDFEDMRDIDIELKIDDREIFPAGFPAELFSANMFRNIEDCMLKVDFPEKSKIEGSIAYGNNKSS
jgi:hypothetical protein